MKIVEVRGHTGSSKILIGETLGNAGTYIPEGKPIVITDKNVWRLYKDEFPDADIIKIGTGEKIKNLDTVNEIYRRLIDFGADRSSFIVGIGGGIVCDIAGFAASTYMRGIRFGFVSTTLLSQVDASTGGKNGVNMGGYKNMVGVFNQPEFVICDHGMLNTLPKAEISCGLAEIVKHALIQDKKMFEYLEDHYSAALLLKTDVIEHLISVSVAIKSGIVNEDEREKGERRKLNFGHTFGHAIEKTTKHPHGEAVSIGMMMAGRLSERKGYLAEKDVNRIRLLLENFDLPTRIKMDRGKMITALTKDKKKEGDQLHFVLLKGIGNAVVEPMTINELADVFG